MNTFGIDIKSIVGRAFKGQLGKLTYTAINKDFDPVAGTETTTTTDHVFDGIIDNFTAYESDSSLIESGDKKVIVIADSLAIAPKQGDKIEGHRVINVDPDPLGATYEIQVR